MVLSQITIGRPPPPQKKKELTLIFIEPTFQTILGRKKMLELFFKCWKKNVVAIFFFNIFFLSDLKKNCAYVANDFKNFFLLRKKCLKNLVGLTAEMPLSANLFRLESSIQKHAGSRGALLVGDAGGRSSPLIKKMKKKNFDQKNVQKFF